MTKITEAQVLAELEKAIAKGTEPEGAYTVPDLAELMNTGQQTVRGRLQILNDAGRLERTTVVRVNLAGQMQRRIAYRILPEEDGE